MFCKCSIFFALNRIPKHRPHVRAMPGALWASIMQFPDSIFEQLLFITVRIEVLNALDKKTIIGTGTGFFFNFNLNGKTFPVLVTNRHVVQPYFEFRILFTQKDSTNQPALKHRIEMYYSRDGGDFDWLFHPLDEVDLAILPLGPAFRQLELDNKQAFYKSFLDCHIPTVTQWIEFDAVEEILMIGYPNGLWDSFNNRPIIRRGITATHPAVAFNGQREFLIDAACFPGSSGSPVIICNPSMYTEKRTGNINMGGGRFFLLGILRAGPQCDINGELKVVDIPMTQVAIGKIQIPNNLGFVIRSERLHDFMPLLEELEAKANAATKTINK